MQSIEFDKKDEYLNGHIVLTPRGEIDDFANIGQKIHKACVRAVFGNGAKIVFGKLTPTYLYLHISYPDNLLIEDVVNLLRNEVKQELSLGHDYFWHKEYLTVSGGTEASHFLTEEAILKYVGKIHKTKKIKSVVTGGAGFIGSTLVDKLIELGHEVIVIDNLYSGVRSYVNEAAKFYEVDICDQDKIREIFDDESADGGIDYVFHLAAQIDVRLSVKDPVFDNQVNVLGSLNILDNAYRHGVKKVLFASTGGALYGGAEQIPTLEEYPTYPFSPYGIHKLTFEKYLSYFYKVYGQNYTSLRFANIYGPRQYKGGEAGVVSIFIDNAVNDRISFINGDGLQTRDYVYVGDVVNAFVTAAQSDYVGEINISTGIENNLLDILSAIEKALGREVKKEFREAMPGEERRSCLDYSKANKILNWQPRIFLDEGIKRTIEWAKGLGK